ncbi:MAG: tetratricopeptide repeat protein [Muribaculaceae bacterium]|jgi:tetratricopeptide (TPR) repeat protein|nr:tetratricopeptide repeat protein [Muribaculaceae bacterium]
MKKNLIFFLFICLTTLAATAQSLGIQADSAYAKEDYGRAATLYEQSIASEGQSSTAWYNLGNAYFRRDNLGKAVVCYQRALKLDPTNEDARQNLEFVRSRIQDRPEDDTPFVAKLHRNIVSSATANTWAWTAFALFALLCGAVALYIFSRNIAMRKTGFFGGIVLFFVCAYVITVAMNAADNATQSNFAVVTSPSTQLSSSPRATGKSGDKIITIHEGTTVEIVDSVETPDDPVSPRWYNVKINNGTKAWMRASDAERI